VRINDGNMTRQAVTHPSILKKETSSRNMIRERLKKSHNKAMISTKKTPSIPKVSLIFP
jgi:hypothetical protein